jgi:hypothetical protein
VHPLCLPQPRRKLVPADPVLFAQRVIHRVRPLRLGALLGVQRGLVVARLELGRLFALFSAGPLGVGWEVAWGSAPGEENSGRGV